MLDRTWGSGAGGEYGIMELSQSVPEKGLWMPRDFWLRRLAIIVISSKLFEFAIIVVILGNCVTLAGEMSYPGFQDTDLANALFYSDLVFLAIFTVEMLLKMVALGWNILDFTIVATGYIALGPAGNYSAVRAIRVLRTLRTIYMIKGLQQLVTTLLLSLPLIVDVLYLALFFFTIFGVITTQIYMGEFDKRCGTPDFAFSFKLPGTDVIENVSSLVTEDLSGSVCRGPLFSSVTWVNESGQGPVPTNVNEPHTGHVCISKEASQYEYPDGTYCTPWGNPGIGGWQNFNNILLAWICIFQHVTFTDYSVIMYDGQDAIIMYDGQDAISW
eukprot:gene13777-19685_t